MTDDHRQHRRVRLRPERDRAPTPPSPPVEDELESVARAFSDLYGSPVTPEAARELASSLAAVLDRLLLWDRSATSAGEHHEPTKSEEGDGGGEN